ncbi:hypothetical protein LCGC14_2222620, partial [marine sediment metagenome]
LRRVNTANRSGVQRAIAISAAQVQGDAQRSIQRGGRSGVIVTIAGKRHQRSGPGEPPKTDTGRLASSIFAEFSNGGLRADVGTDVVSRLLGMLLAALSVQFVLEGLRSFGLAAA